MQSTDLTRLAADQLEAATKASSGRSAHGLHGGSDQALRQTVMALAAGRELAEHDSPGEASLQVLRGRVRLVAGDDAWEGAAGQYVVIPPVRHSLAAIEDSVVMLTVVSSRPAHDGQANALPRP